MNQQEAREFTQFYYNLTQEDQMKLQLMVGEKLATKLERIFENEDVFELDKIELKQEYLDVLDQVKSFSKILVMEKAIGQPCGNCSKIIKESGHLLQLREKLEVTEIYSCDDCLPKVKEKIEKIIEKVEKDENESLR